MRVARTRREARIAIERVFRETTVLWNAARRAALGAPSPIATEEIAPIAELRSHARRVHQLLQRPTDR